MATPTQGQLAEERAAVLADIADKQALYDSMIAKGQLNAAREVLTSINASKAQAASLDNSIKNYTQFSATRAAQDAEIAATANFESRTNPANQQITSTNTTVTTTGGTATTITVPQPTLSSDAAATAAQANLRASAFTANPNGRFGNSTIDRAAASGAITAQEAAALKAGSIPENERLATASSSRSAATRAIDEGTTTAPPTTTATANPNTTANTTEVQRVVAEPVTLTSESNPTNNSRIVNNPDGTKSEVTVNTAEGTVSSTPIASSNIAQQTETTITVSQQIENATPSTVVADTPSVQPDEAVSEQKSIPTDSDPSVSTARSLSAPAQPNSNTTVDTESDPAIQSRQTTIAPTNTASSINAGPTVQPAPIRQATTRQQDDWRLRLKLAKNAEYFYTSKTNPGILKPLKETDGVVFPYTPTIAMNYRSYYEVSDLVHTNYKQYFYKNSSVEELSITAEFTAQDTYEANYMLAVIHFFRTITKMFYGKDGKDGGVVRGTPPPLCYLLGFGQYQFSDHPVLISNFQFTMPNDVDYIRATNSPSVVAGTNIGGFSSKPGFTSGYSPGLDRLFGSGLARGGISASPAWNPLSNTQATYVPTKMQMVINAIPIVTRSDVARSFSLDEYSSGDLIKKGYW